MDGYHKHTPPADSRSVKPRWRQITVACWFRLPEGKGHRAGVASYPQQSTCQAMRGSVLQCGTHGRERASCCRQDPTQPSLQAPSESIVASRLARGCGGHLRRPERRLSAPALAFPRARRGSWANLVEGRVRTSRSRLHVAAEVEDGSVEDCRLIGAIFPSSHRTPPRRQHQPEAPPRGCAGKRTPGRRCY